MEMHNVDENTFHWKCKTTEYPKVVNQPSSFPDCFPLTLESVEIDPVFGDLLCMQQKGWLGSDVVHSCPLGDGKILWLFGDTFYGELKDGARVAGASMIQNSIAIQNIGEGFPGRVNYYQGGTQDKPADFFPHSLIEGKEGKDYDRGFFWPTWAFCYRGELYVFAYDLRWGGKTKLVIQGTMLRINNPLACPAQWNVVDTVPIEATIKSFLMFHTAFVIEEPYVYCFGYEGNPGDGHGKLHGVLARIHGDDLAAGRVNERMEYWVDHGDGPRWGGRPENLVPIYSPGSTENGIQYVKEWDLYVMVSSTYGGALVVMTAKELTGPWSEAAPFYMPPHYAEVPMNIMWYAARPHPELSSRPNELVVSYATNSCDGIEPLFGTKEGAEIYRPRFIRVRVSKANSPRFV